MAVKAVELSALQFGHDLSVVETLVERSQMACSYWLQFGHDLSVVETSRFLFAAHPTYCFNSATTFQSWKPNSTVGILTENIELQFGHDLSVVETKVSSFIIDPK